MAELFGMVSDSISMSNRTADQLIKTGNGDAALLFVFLLRHKGNYDPARASKLMGWSDDRFAAALALLQQQRLIEASPEVKPEPVSRAAAPDYSAADVTLELSDPASDFSSLLEEVERLMSKKLTTADTKMLLELFDYLALPGEVIVLLVSHMVRQEEERSGIGHRPRMSQIRSEAYLWRQKGIDSAEAAEAHLKKLRYFATREGEILKVMGIHRQPVDAERKYINSWLDMDLSLDLISLAYERTILNTGSLKWSYMASILRRWQQAGYRTPEDVRAKDNQRTKTFAPHKEPALPTEDEWAKKQQEAERIREYMANRKGE